jgi:hypothetical protein
MFDYLVRNLFVYFFYLLFSIHRSLPTIDSIIGLYILNTSGLSRSLR